MATADIGEEQKLKISVYKDVKNICLEESKKMSLEIDKPVIHLMSELTWNKLQSIAQDLEAFAKHAKRSTVNADDVKLLVRHNTKLKEAVTQTAEEHSRKKSKKNKDAVENDSANDNCETIVID